MSRFNFQTERTICFLLKDGKILLPMKKRGFGVGNYNGYGGKKDSVDKTIEETAIRELWEEAKVRANVAHLDRRAVIDFHFPYKPEFNQRVHVYFLEQWEDEPVETEEMKPEWFDRNAIPYNKMWDSDRIWLPLIMSGKIINATFIWKDDNKTVDTYKITEI